MTKGDTHFITTKYAVVVSPGRWVNGGGLFYKAQALALTLGGTVMEYRPMGWRVAMDKRGIVNKAYAAKAGGFELVPSGK